MEKIQIDLVLAVFVILVAGMFLITPNGIIVIVENPVLRFGLALIGVALGIASIVSRRRLAQS